MTQGPTNVQLQLQLPHDTYDGTTPDVKAGTDPDVIVVLVLTMPYFILSLFWMFCLSGWMKLDILGRSTSEDFRVWDGCCFSLFSFYWNGKPKCFGGEEKEKRTLLK